ncbi:peptidoglycan-binding domain-containing protein [Halotia wernerae UHCC 0503]|nr:peptidoglycan-binding domain-containing protein [Halotia wernerae UHCC 0503]
MNWKVLALIPTLTLAVSLPAYSKTLNNSQHIASATPAAQGSQPSTMQKPSAMKKPSTMQKSSAMKKPSTMQKSNVIANHSTVLRIGSKGNAVKTAQTFLKQQGFYTASVNGVFDNKTRSAVMKFQKAKGLKADGIVGRHTLAAMN